MWSRIMVTRLMGSFIWFLLFFNSDGIFVRMRAWIHHLNKLKQLFNINWPKWKEKKTNWLVEMRKSTDKSEGFWINPQFFNAIVCRPLFERSKIYDFIFFTFPWKMFLFHHGKIVVVPFKCCQQFIKDKKK